jgi:ribonuclease PH
MARLYEQGLLRDWPMATQVASVAVGLVDGEARVDPDYGEDFDCDVDLNLVFTADGRLIEVQGTAEGEPFTRAQLDEILDVGWTGAQQVIAAQREIVNPRLEPLGLSLPETG